MKRFLVIELALLIGLTATAQTISPGETFLSMPGLTLASPWFLVCSSSLALRFPRKQKSDYLTD